MILVSKLYKIVKSIILWHTLPWILFYKTLYIFITRLKSDHLSKHTKKPTQGSTLHPMVISLKGYIKKIWRKEKDGEKEMKWKREGKMGEKRRREEWNIFTA